MVDDLPSILDKLRTRAKNNIGTKTLLCVCSLLQSVYFCNILEKITDPDEPLATERQNLEGLFLQLRRSQKRLATESGIKNPSLSFLKQYKDFQNIFIITADVFLKVHGKDRAKEVRSQRKIREKAHECVEFINDFIRSRQTRNLSDLVGEGSEMSDYWKELTQQDFEDGIFSWQTEGGRHKINNILLLR